MEFMASKRGSRTGLFLGTAVITKKYNPEIILKRNALKIDLAYYKVITHVEYHLKYYSALEKNAHESKI